MVFVWGGKAGGPPDPRELELGPPFFSQPQVVYFVNGEGLLPSIVGKSRIEKGLADGLETGI